MTITRAKTSARHHHGDVIAARDRRRLSYFAFERTAKGKLGLGFHDTTRPAFAPSPETVARPSIQLTITATALGVDR